MLNNGEVCPSDEIRGKRDAKDGKPAESGASDSYQDAYDLHVSATQALANMNIGRVSIFQ